MDMVLYALLMNKLKSVASGISNIQAISNGLRFITTNSNIIDVTLPTHTHNNLDTILEKFTIDTNNILLFDGQSLDKQIDLTNYVQKETGKGLFTGNYNDLLNKPASQQPNKSISFTSSDWTQDLVDLNKYTLEITHGLKTIDILGTVYNSNGDEETIGFKPIDIDRVRLTNIIPIDGRIVLNYISTITTGVSVGITDLNGFTSDDLTEGTNNKYITTSQKAIVESINITSPSDGQVLSYDSATGKIVNETIFDEKVKMSASDTDSKYLSDLLDNLTIQNVSGQLVCKNIEGVTVGITNINTLSGMTENIKSKFDTLANAMKFTGTVPTKADLNTVTGQSSGDVKIVLSDESNLNKKITYVYDGTSWTSLGEFNITVRDFSVNKINLVSEVTGILPLSNIDNSTLIKTTDIIDDMTHSDVDKPSSANQVKVLKGLVDAKTQTNDTGVAGNTIDTYSIDKLITLFNNKQNKIFVQSTQPSSPNLNTLWIDTTNSLNYTIKCFNGSAFVQVGSSGGITIENWSTLTSYISNSSFVIYNSNLYRCKITHISTMTFESINWDLVGSDVTKDGVETLTNKTLTSPIISSISNTGTLTLPTTTDTLIGKTTTDTLTNKSLVDASTFIVDNSDMTKKVQFEASGITTGTTKTLSIPNKDGTLALTSDITPINDVSTSKYIDIGNVRMQWGSGGSGGDVNGQATITFSAPFANTGYSFTGNLNRGSSSTNLYSVFLGARTTTTINVLKKWQSGGTTATATESVDWVAIGLKP